jgi:U3 small nucleolar RNA-associated protein 6
LATEAHPSSAAAWEGRIDLEAQALGCSTAAAAAAAGGSGGTHQQQKQQQLFGLVVQAVQQVPAAEAVQLWETGFTLAESLAAAGSTAQLAAVQKQLLSAVTAASVRGPESGGLGAVAGRCLEVLWRVSGAAAARKLWQRLLLLPPAGGDMFRAMVQLEQSAADAAVAESSDPQQQRRQSAGDVVKRVRGVYEAWSAAYGGVDAELWVEWALFEQQQGKAGTGKLYWRAVKALDTPEDFIAAYRQQIGAV